MNKGAARGAERLNKIIAMAGVASRRRADELIASGLVVINGRVERNLGSRAVWGVDAITVDGQALPHPPRRTYLMLNKPFGYVSTLRDPEGRPIVRDLIREVRERVYPVGRLDFDSQGLLILTNDGELAYRLTHPRYRVPRTYKVTIQGSLSEASMERLRRGIMLGDWRTSQAHVAIRERGQERSVVRVTVFEGRYREVRRMFEAVGHSPIKLIRIGYGSLHLGNLKVGTYRGLKDSEVKALRSSVGLD